MQKLLAKTPPIGDRAIFYNQYPVNHLRSRRTRWRVPPLRKPVKEWVIGEGFHGQIACASSRATFATTTRLAQPPHNRWLIRWGGVMCCFACVGHQDSATRTSGSSVTTRIAGRRLRGRPFAFGGVHRNDRACPWGRACGLFIVSPGGVPRFVPHHGGGSS
jgi:hypothetical protein